MIWLSNGRRELVEGCLYALAGGDIGGDFVVPAAQVLDQAHGQRPGSRRTGGVSPRIGRSQAFSRP